MAVVESLKQRIEILERNFAQLLSEYESAATRSAREEVKEWRLAVTGGTPAYPLEADDPTVYPIIFADGTFTKAQGNQEGTFSERSANVQDYAYSLGQEFIPKDSVLAVFKQNNRWWIPPVGAANTQEPPVVVESPMAIVEVVNTVGAAGSVPKSTDTAQNTYCLNDGYLIRGATIASTAASAMCPELLFQDATERQSPIWILDLRAPGRAERVTEDSDVIIDTANHPRKGYYFAFKLYSSATIGGYTRPVYAICDHNDFVWADRYVSNEGHFELQDDLVTYWPFRTAFNWPTTRHSAITHNGAEGRFYPIIPGGYLVHYSINVTATSNSPSILGIRVDAANYGDNWWLEEDDKPYTFTGTIYIENVDASTDNAFRVELIKESASVDLTFERLQIFVQKTY